MEAPAKHPKATIMELSVQVPISASKEAIWNTITDIENAANTIGGINSIEVLEKPDSLIGLKWKESRTMFGKEATETMWITHAEENSFYQTRAESHGSIYISKLWISEENGSNHLHMSFQGEAQTFGAKLMSFLMAPMMKGSMKKLVLKDLEDIKKAVEEKAN